MSTVSILTDVTKCTGCEKCVAACKQQNCLGPDRRDRQRGAIDDLSSSRYTTILRDPGGRTIRQQCRHCLEPACASACLVGALHKAKDPDGPVIYDKTKCMGCRYCMVACPFSIPRYDWDKSVPYVRKCSMCYENLKSGGGPACVEACPQKATIFGTREEMLAEAKRRIDAEPNEYIQRIYGAEDVGGTSVLYVSDVELDCLGWKPQPRDGALPQLTWASLSKVPPIALGIGAAMTGIYWIIGRRMRMQEMQRLAEQRAATDHHAEETPDGSEEKE